jgi:hypothetical protein
MVLSCAKIRKGRGISVIAFQKEKIGNAMAYFAKAYYERVGYYPRQTWIYKFLALLDFRFLKKAGVPSLGLEYDAMEKGAVPAYLYDNRFSIKSRYFEFIPTQTGSFEVRNLVEPNLDYFSDDELDIMDDILDTYATSDLETVIDDAHKEIRAWQIAWEKAQQIGRKRVSMEFSDEFDEDIFKKDEMELSPQEARFLCYLDMQNLEEHAG